MLGRTVRLGNFLWYHDARLDCSAVAAERVFWVRAKRRPCSRTSATAPRCGLVAVIDNPPITLSAGKIEGQNAAASRAGDSRWMLYQAGEGSSTTPRRPLR